MPYKVRENLLIGNISDAAEILQQGSEQITHILSVLSSASVSFFTEWRNDIVIPAQEIRKVYFGGNGSEGNVTAESSTSLSHQKLLYSLEYAGKDLKFVRMAVALRDMESENLLDYLEVCLDFIEESRKKGCVLVHCFAEPRSCPTMVNTRSSATDGNPDVGNTLAQQNDALATIAARLDILDELRDKVAALEVHNRNPTTKKKKIYADDSEEESESHSRRHFRPPYAKIEFPKFSGGDPRGWILKAEKYFRYYETPDEEKVDIASMYLEGDALDMFSWALSERTVLYWEELVKILQEQYGPPEYQNPDEYLAAVQQVGTVQEYRVEWARRVARVKNWPDHCLLGIFLNGLKEELRSEVRIHKPQSVYRATSLALEMEKKLQGTKSTRPCSTASSARATYSTNSGRNQSVPDSSAKTSTSHNPTSQNPGSSQSVIPFRSNSWDTTRQERRNKGLCFRCGDPFRPGHRCTTSTFSLMEVDVEGNPIPETFEPAPEMEEIIEEAEISFNAILGTSSAATMKLQGSIQNRNVLCLVDSGSTHNFFSERLVNELNLVTTSIPVLGVQIGDGSLVRCGKICKAVKLQLPGLSITQDFYPFSLSGSDLVLGIKWLASLNTIQANWN
ncbi:unnamed protein product, partial [Cuscuta campestris]